MSEKKTVTSEKAELRRRVKLLGKTLSRYYLETSDRAIMEKVLDLPEYKAAERIFCYVSFGFEAGTRGIIEDAWARGKTVLVPRCLENGAGIMELVPVTGWEDFMAGAYGIPEPLPEIAGVWSVAEGAAAPCDFAIIPCLSCDEEGRRLGRGGGYYDRFLAQYLAAGPEGAPFGAATPATVKETEASSETPHRASAKETADPPETSQRDAAMEAADTPETSQRDAAILCRRMLMCDEIPTEPHDIRVQLVIFD